MKEKFIELRDDERLWATVEHSGDVCKFVIYNEANGSTALVLPRRLLPNLITALQQGSPENPPSWDLQTR